MDTYGFAAIIAGGVIYFIAKRKSPAWMQFGILVFGVGLGLVIGALWAVAIINRTF